MDMIDKKRIDELVEELSRRFTEPFTRLLTFAVKAKVSDIFIIAGRAITFKSSSGRLNLLSELKPSEEQDPELSLSQMQELLDEIIRTIHEKLEPQLPPSMDQKLSPAITQVLIRIIYGLGDRPLHHLSETGDDDFSFALAQVSRFRVSAYRQRGSLAAVVRVINFELPKPHELGITDELLKLTETGSGMILITGPAGSGKSTTQACMIDDINRNKYWHIITLEDPLEFLHSHNKSIVSQREINSDTESYATALRAALRQSPNVILLGEMRDRETIQIAMAAAETGHLVISTLHTRDAEATISRIIDAFPANQQQQVAIQLSNVLQAVVSQVLVSTDNARIDTGRKRKQKLVFEIMKIQPAIRTLIREHKFNQIKNYICRPTINEQLFTLEKNGEITHDAAVAAATNPDMIKK